MDLLGGRVVSLMKGNPDAPTGWGLDPLAAAQRWEREGADGLHLVDLDRAFGWGNNERAIREILSSASLPTQVGGGIRSHQEALRMLKLGARRVVIGTMAFANLEAMKRLLLDAGADSVVVALDYSDGMVLTHGWRRESGMGLLAAAGHIETLGVGTAIFTATERDGTGAGPDLTTYELLRRKTKLRIVASGGIRTLDDLRGLRALGVDGAILGRALYEGSIRLADARSKTN